MLRWLTIKWREHMDWRGCRLKTSFLYTVRCLSVKGGIKDHYAVLSGDEELANLELQNVAGVVKKGTQLVELRRNSVSFIWLAT